MTREECIKQASSYIKSTPYSNPNQFTKWYYGNNQSASWCGIFIDYVIKHDLNCDWLNDCTNFAYMPTVYQWAVNKGYYTKDYTKAKTGDLVLFSFDTSRPNHISHIGIVESQTANGIISVEGNTSSGTYKENCVARKTRNKGVINGVILLPYKEESMPFKVGDYVYALEDIPLYTTIEYKKNEYTLKKGQKAYVRCIKGNNVALADPNTHQYWASAWTNQLDKLTKEEPQPDYKTMYEEEVAKNKVLQDKINKAILDLQ